MNKSMSEPHLAAHDLRQNNLNLPFMTGSIVGL